MAHRNYYSSESGIETDQDTRSQDEIQLVAIIPNKMICNAQEPITLVFDKELPRKGAYRVEFKGRKRERMEVKAEMLNRCTLVVNAPDYSPPEQVQVHVRRISQGTTIIGQSLPFQFISREDVIGSLLEECKDPVTSMCESLGISSSDINALDKALTVSFKANIPPGFNLLGLRNYGMEKEVSNSLYPTLLHFAAAFGLFHFARDCLCQCPGVVEATKLRNYYNERPSDIANRGKYDNLYHLFTSIEANGSEDIYEPMNEAEESYYTAMACQQFINLQLWQPTDDTPAQDESEFYEDMTTSPTEETDDGGYIITSPPGCQATEEIYTDMEGGEDGQYTDVTHPTGRVQVADDAGYITCRQTGNIVEQKDDFYEPMVADIESSTGSQGSHGLYDTPSNLPVSPMYPSERSLSMSQGRKPDTLQKMKRKAPAIPTRPNEKPTIPRTTSSASRQSVISNISSVSSSSVSTVGSGFQADIESESEENIFMSQTQLMEVFQQNKEAPPPVPAPDYEKKQSGKHSRSQTAPIKASDVAKATSLLTASRPTSYRGEKRPPLNPRVASDLAPKPGPRRTSEGFAERSVSPAPSPASVSSRQGIPTPFAQLMHQATEEESPPPPPVRLTSAAKPVAPPRARKM